VVAVHGRVEVVLVASTPGVRKRLTEPGDIDEVPALYAITAVASVHLQITFLGTFSRHQR